MIFKAFNPLEYFEHEVPPEASDWGRWINGEELTFKSKFAQYCWWQVLQINDDFIDWDRSAKHYAKYIGDPVDGELDESSGRSKLLTQEFDEAIQIASLAIGSGSYPNSLKIEEIIFQETKGNYRKVIQAYATYALLCFDKGIAALITNDAPIAAEFFMYAKAGINIVAEYKKTFPGAVNASDTVEPLSISEMSSMGGKARHRSSPLYPVQMEVENIWLDWQNRKYLYRSNAEFAQEMMKVYKVLENPRTVTTWCTRWKKESGRSAG